MAINYLVEIVGDSCLLSHNTVGKALPTLLPGLAMMLALADRSRGKLDITRGRKQCLGGPTLPNSC